MFFSDGFVYGGNISTGIKVKEIKLLPDKIMIITFDNNEQRVFDATILRGEAFVPLNDETIYNAFSIDHGVVTWKNGEIDCAPEYMYNNSYEYIPKESADVGL